MDRNKIFRVAKNEYLKWITNPKMIIILVMLIFIYDYVIKEFVSAAGKMGVKLQALEGFIGTSNSRLLLITEVPDGLQYRVRHGTVRHGLPDNMRHRSHW